MKLTKWIPGNVKPVRKGVYQRGYATAGRYCLWDGKVWCVFADTPEDAADCKGVVSAVQDLPWRGLAEKPE